MGSKNVTLGAAAIFLAYTGWLLLEETRGQHSAVIESVISTAISMIPLAFAVQTTRCQQGRARAGWAVLAMALLCWTVGEAVWAYREIAGLMVDKVSIADVCYLGFSIAAVGSLLLFWKHRGGRAQVRIVLDGVIVAASLFAASWALGKGRLLEARPEDRVESVVAVAYPVLDIVVVTVATLVLISASPSQRRYLTPLTLGLTTAALTDSAYAYFSLSDEHATGNLIDVGWVAAMLLIAVAAAVGRTAPDGEHAPDDVPGWASVWLPYLPLMLAVVALAVTPAAVALSRPVLVVGSLLIVAVMLRQYLAVDHDRRLILAVTDQALHDPLTGLANRTKFREQLERALSAQSPARPAVGVIVVDLVDFKLVNDTLGHAAGDDLLRAAGQRVQACLRSSDTLARLGGDEFAVVVSGHPETLEGVADRVAKSFNRPVTVKGQDFPIRLSVGIAVVRPENPAVSAEELIRRADLAMYAAKRSHSAKVRSYSDDLDQQASSEAARRLGTGQRTAQAASAIRLLGQLRRAIHDDDLELVYRPKVKLADGALVGLEASLWWPHPDHGLLPPGAFLPLARQHALTGALADLVLNRALDDARAWHAEGLDLPVSIDLFPQSLAAADPAQQIARALADRGLPPHALTIEITEDLLLGDVGLVRRVLGQLRERGIGVVIDDFGSGSSSLSYLRDLPVDEVKLNPDFIVPILTEPRAAAVLMAVLDLARALGIATVAEGVDDEATAAAVRHFGCDMAQGLHFGPPLSAAEVLGQAARLAGTHPPSAGVVLLK